MDSGPDSQPAPFSAPPPTNPDTTVTLPSAQTPPPVQVQPIGGHTVPTGTQITTPTYIQVNPETAGSNTTSNVLLIISGLCIVGAIIISVMGMGAIEDDNDVWIADIQQDFDDSAIWSGSGAVNETVAFDPFKKYSVLLEQGITDEINLTVLSSRGEQTFYPEVCEDRDPENEIDDCKDFDHYHVGTIGGADTSTVNLNTTGEVVFIDNSILEQKIGDTLWNNLLGPIVRGFCGGCCVCNIGLIMMIIGVIKRS